jgi:hypothetical protein
MSGFWAVFWLAIILKIPIAALFAIIWWALREPPVPEADRDDGGGGSSRDPHPRIRRRAHRGACGWRSAGRACRTASAERAASWRSADALVPNR